MKKSENPSSMIGFWAFFFLGVMGQGVGQRDNFIIMIRCPLPRNSRRIEIRTIWGRKWGLLDIYSGKKYQKWEKLAIFGVLEYDRSILKARGMIRPLFK